MPKISIYSRTRVVELIESGLSQRQVAKELKISRCGVQEVLKKYKKEGKVEDMQRTGRPKAFNERQERLLVRNVKIDPFLTASALRNKFNWSKMVTVQTVRNILRRYKLFGRITAVKPLLSKLQKKKRFEWCKEHIQWAPTKWNSVIFSDESAIELRSKRRKYVRRPKKTRYNEKYILKSTKFTSKLLVWGGVKANGKRFLVRCIGNVNSQEYQIILDEALPHLYNSRCIFQHDGATCHTSRSTTEYLDQKQIRILKNWPPQSPDLNVIENIWDYLKQKLDMKVTNTLDDLWTAAYDEFHKIPDEYIKRLFDSIPRRLTAVLSRKGGNTKY